MLIPGENSCYPTSQMLYSMIANTNAEREHSGACLVGSDPFCFCIGTADIIFSGALIQRLGIFLLHIPVGFLPAPMALIGRQLAILSFALAQRQTRRQYDERRIPLMGAMAAIYWMVCWRPVPLTADSCQPPAISS